MKKEVSIVVYGTAWCGDCLRAKTILDRFKIAYNFIDIDLDPKAGEFVESVNAGFRSVPTILFPDGSILVEPSDPELMDHLKLV